MTFSEELKKKRLATGLSLREANARYGISYTVLSRMENGTLLDTSAVNVYRISRFLNWDAADMLKKMSAQASKRKRKSA